MRYLFGFVGALALSLALMAGCSETTGTGGSGGSGGFGGEGGSGGIGGSGGKAGAGSFGGEGGVMTDATLEVLELRVGDVGGENLLDDFNPNTLVYQTEFPASEGAGVLRVETEDPQATVEIWHDDGWLIGAQPVSFSEAPFAMVDLPMGRSSELRIAVTTQTGTPAERSSEYIVEVERSG